MDRHGIPIFQCKCKGVKIGSYDSQVERSRPAHMKGQTYGTSSDIICLDACIAPQVEWLWSQGISTTGCCCGHGGSDPYIGVIEADILRMLTMGFKIAPNPLDPNRRDSFYPL